MDVDLRSPAATGGTAAKRPLAASTYLLRNAGKSVPFIAVITLAVMLVAGIVAMMNSIPFSIRTIYAYSKEALVVGPRGNPELTPQFVAVVKKETPVPIERLMLVRAAPTVVKSIVGKWPFSFLGMEQRDMKFFLHRNHGDNYVGRLPKPGAPEAMISEPIARNLHLAMGGELMGPKNTDGYSPMSVKVVGIAQTDRWFMFGDIDYHRANHFPPIDLAVVFAHNAKDQNILDRWAEKRFKGERAGVFAYHMLEKDTNEMFKILYSVLDVVIGTLVLVITIMMGMLMNIYQSQRIVEFGLLQALGYTRRQLLNKVLKESLTVVVFGWLFGVLCAYILLRVTENILMHPRAFALDAMDPTAFTYTLPIPISVMLAAIVTIVLRFRKFDPVSIVERRLV